ncbi:NADH-ubiquinone oxidoreductase-F iron-sulfur binding region domain-containing protein [Clostridioides difficile]
MIGAILDGCYKINPTNVDEYIEIGGFEALKKAIGMEPLKICEEIKKSNLKGRGGAAYPTGIKWEQAYNIKGNEKYILCNGDEGEPGTFKDKVIFENLPLRLIEGMIIAAKVLGAKEGFIYIRGEYEAIQRIVNEAIDSAIKAGYLGKNILGTGFSFNIKVLTGAGAYVVGENSALAESAEGKVGRPRMKPPYIKECGLYGKPTLVNNVETFSTIPYIISNGGENYKSLGNEESGGTKLISLCGNVNRRGVYEIPFGTTINDIVYKLGGGTSEGKSIKAVHIGGSSGSIIPRELIDTEYCYEALKKINVSVGSGSILVIDESVDIIEYLLHVYKFFFHESCGKCTPCREGNKQIVNILEKLNNKKATLDDISTLERLLDVMKNASFCGLGKTAPTALNCAIKYFNNDLMKGIEVKR